MRFFHGIYKFLRLPFSEKRLILVAIYYLLFYSFLIYLIPFRLWVDRIGKKKETMDQNLLKDNEKVYVKKVKLSIFRANKILLELGKCFAISLALKTMLSKKRIDTTLFLGVRKANSESLVAHAWLKVGDLTLYGGSKSQHFYKELLSFT